jgi:GDP-L-fucose synthase|tara:strand:- start:858 stop:1745 length:888 start_codon:yes stop_codon:yes gene_type:complete
MKILVTGSTGFVGKHLVERLKLEKHEVIEINSTNFTSMWNLEKNSIDVIVHLAVKTEAGGYCQDHPGEQWIINNSINADMLAYWVDNQQRAHMVTFGSSCGYNNDVVKSEDNYLKDEPETGYEVYGMVKRNLLVGLKALSKEFYMGFNYLIPSVFYGPDYNLNDKHFIFDLIRKIVTAKDLGYTVTLWGDGTQERELIYIDDSIDLIMACINNTESPAIFNLSSGKTHTLKEYAQTICDIVGYDSNKIIWDKDQFVGSPSKKLVNTHLTKFKFTPLKEGLEKTIKYYENCIRNSK